MNGPPGTRNQPDLNGPPGMKPDAVFAGIICAIFVVCFSGILFLFVRSCSP